MLRFPLTLLLTVLLTTMTMGAAPWEFANPTVPFSQTPAVVYGAGRWVGVGPTGKIITSTNGIAWTTGTLLTGDNLLDVTYATGRFVACGGNGTLITSVDGLSWEHRTTGNRAELRDVIYGNGRWVLTGMEPAGRDPLIFSSSDLETWSIFRTEGKYTTGGSTAEGRTVMFGDGKFLVPMPNSQAFVSTNGLDWTRQSNNLNFSFPRASTYDSGKFYCIDLWGELASSPDGTTWTALPFPYSMYNDASDLFVEGNRMIITTERGFYTSTNGGLSWTQRGIYSDATGSPECGGVAKGDGVYLVMAYDGSAIRSTDFTWQASYAGANVDNFADVTHGDGTFVAVGEYDDNSSYGAIWSSADGGAWTKRRQEGLPLKGVCYGNGTWVCVGEKHPAPDALILTSIDLSTWTEQSNPASYDLQDVTFANGLFVAVGGQYAQAVVLTSPDGVAWTQRTSNARGPLAKVLHANGIFVAVGSRNSGNAGEIISSPDGITWTRCPLNISHPLNCIAYGNSIFLATGSYESAMKSANGSDWAVLNPGNTPSDVGWSDLVFDGSCFVACSAWTTRSSAYTTDGVEWSQELMGSKLNAMVAAEGKIIAVGAGDHILTRPIGESPAGPAAVHADGPALSWSALPDAAGYQIYKRLAGAKRWEDAAPTQPAGRTEVLLEGLPASTAYEFSVQAITANGLSQPSSTSATTFGHLDMWMLANFQKRENSGTAADSADPDGDGLENLLEYARGTDPKVFQPRYTPPQSAAIYQTFDGKRVVQFIFEFALDRRKTDTTCYVETSTDLTTWTRVTESIGGGKMTVLDEGSGWGVSDSYRPDSSTPTRSVLVGKMVYLPAAAGQGQLHARFGIERKQP